LSESVKRNGFTQKVILLNKAVSDTDGDKVKLFVNKAGSVDNRTFSDGGIKVGEQYDVETVTIDSIVAEVEKDGFVPANIIIKIDIQGNEPRAIRGMTGVMSRYPSVALLFEFDPALLKAAGFVPCEFARELFSLGFDRIVNINDAAQSLSVIGSVQDLTKLIEYCESMNYLDPRKYTNLLCYRNLNGPLVFHRTRRFATIQPQGADEMLRIAKKAFDEKGYSKAAEYFELAASMKPDEINAYVGMALSAKELGNADMLRASMQKIRSLTAPNPGLQHLSEKSNEYKLEQQTTVGNK
jgi:FkbM family methyltransferase